MEQEQTLESQPQEEQDLQQQEDQEQDPQQQEDQEQEQEQLIPNETINNATSPTMKHNLLVATYILYTIIVGYTISTQPTGAGWRYFSWHPFLMITGFIAMMGVSALIKKKGGYVNTKLHGMISSAGTFMVFGGLYVIYQHKESLGKDHVTTTHAICGIVTVAACVMAMLAGGVFLHPDFGFDKTNKVIR